MSIKDRVKQAVMEWGSDKLRSELLAYIDQDTDEELEEYYFYDIATEDEQDQGRLNCN